jgi:UDP-N-acetylmuramoyl-tripeptide--D-alanyl-D-alanine ligase
MERCRGEPFPTARESGSQLDCLGGYTERATGAGRKVPRAVFPTRSDWGNGQQWKNNDQGDPGKYLVTGRSDRDQSGQPEFGDRASSVLFEMGINHEGEMDILADIFRPDAAVITNIGSAHIGNLGSRQAIAREKKKIFRHFSGTQKAFLYEEEYYYSYLSEGLKGTVVPFGPKCTKGFEGSEDLGLDGNILHWEGLRIRFPLFGAHNVRNALASLSVSAELGISKSKIKDGLECTRPLFGRSQIINGAVTVIQDCYNSNPDSVGQVFAFLSSLVHGGAKIAVLGSMKELGTETEDAHRRIGVEAAKAGFRGIFLFGEEMETAWTSVRESGYSQKLFWTLDIEKLRKELLEFIEPGDLVLIKGSRSVELERLVPDITRP